MQVRHHAELPHLAADRDHLRDAGDGQQPRPHHPIGQLRNCIAETEPSAGAVIATSMISPMMEETGAIIG
jgi:hypothetical protein